MILKRKNLVFKDLKGLRNFSFGTESFFTFSSSIINFSFKKKSKIAQEYYRYFSVNFQRSQKIENA